jgi:molybdopterin-binding protein
MVVHKLSDAAALIGVSDDTLRRWQQQGRFSPVDVDGRAGIEGTELARLAAEHAATPDHGPEHTSARNQLRGIVTRITTDTVMAQVELVCGPYRVVSLVSRESVEALGLEPGSVAWATVKSTNVSLEVSS